MPFRLKRKFNDNSIFTFRTELTEVSWFDGVPWPTDINTMFNAFFKKIFEIFEYSFPLEYCKGRPMNDRNKWISAETREMSRMVKEMATINKRIKNPMYNERYLALRSFYRKRIKLDKKSFNDRRIEGAKNYSKACWDIINDGRDKNKCRLKGMEIHDPFSENNHIIKNPKKICDIFNSYFVDITNNIEKPNLETLTIQKNACQSFFLYPTSPSEIFKIIKIICNKKSTGVDDIPGTILTDVADIISEPLSVLINCSFSQGSYPECLKTSRIIPIYKGKGNQKDIKNYRPVALQSHFGKVFEYAFNSRLSKYLEKFELISESQNGFRSGFSTQTALNAALDHINEALNNKNIALGLFFDMSRAFDTVDYEVLGKKLSALGVRGPPLTWIKSYLSNRSQIVEVDGVRSSEERVNKGTPQGSCLSPTLFNIYINDLPDYIAKCGRPVLYADDSNIIVHGGNPEELAARGNTTVKVMSEWCKRNGLILNTEKTIFVQFGTKNKKIDYNLLIRTEKKSIEGVMSTKFLGVHIDQKLTWSAHIESMLPKLSSYCYLIRNIRDTVSMDVVRLLYFGLVQATMAYGIAYWGLASEVQQVFTSQKKIIRMIARISPTTSCRESFKTHKIMTLASLYIYSVIMCVLNNKDILSQRREIHDHDTRYRNEYQLPFSRLTVGQKSPTYRVVH